MFCVKIAAKTRETFFFSAKHHLARTNVCLLFKLGCKSTRNLRANNNSGISRNLKLDSLSEVYSIICTFLSNKKLK